MLQAVLIRLELGDHFSRHALLLIEMMSFSVKLANQMVLTLDIILDSNAGNLQMSYSGSHDSILPLFYQAIGFILNM